MPGSPRARPSSPGPTPPSPRPANDRRGRGPKEQADRAFARTRELETGNATAKRSSSASPSRQPPPPSSRRLQRCLAPPRPTAYGARAAPRMAGRGQRTEIKAPAAGMISRRTAHLGRHGPGHGRPAVPHHRGRRHRARGRCARRPRSPGCASVSAGPHRRPRRKPAPARSAWSRPRSSRTTRLGRVRVAVDRPGPRHRHLRPRRRRGRQPRQASSCRSRPCSSVRTAPIVQVVRDGVVEPAASQIGLRANGVAEITKGIGAGEDVVAIAGTFLRDGDRRLSRAEAARTMSFNISAWSIRSPIPRARPLRRAQLLGLMLVQHPADHPRFRTSTCRSSRSP